MRTIGKVYLLIALLLTSGCSTFRDSFSDQLQEKRRIQAIKQDPVAYAAYKQRLVQVGETVEIDGSSSRSLQNKNLTFNWRLLEQPEGSVASLLPDSHLARLTIDRPGRYRVRLSVNDGVFDSEPFDLLFSTDLDDLDKVKIVAMGDAGTGAPSQSFVGEAIRQVCELDGCDFVIGMGDNIYKAGPKNLDDQQFQDKFEIPYQNLSLPFYMVLGNHDSSGLSAGDGGFNARGQIEIEYTHHSDIWAMPDRYYQIKAPLHGNQLRFQPDLNPQPLVELFALDSTPITSAPDFIPRYRINLYSQNMGNWLSAGIHNSKAQWKLAYAHHPYISNGKHGNAGNYDSIGDYAEKLKKYMPKLNKYLFQRVAGTYYRDFYDQHMCGELDMYLAGHDHNMQWLAPMDKCGKTHFVVSGAGAKSNNIYNPKRNPFYWQCSKTIGFFWIQIVADSMLVKIYRVDEMEGGHQLAYAARFSQKDPNAIEILHGEGSCVK